MKLKTGVYRNKDIREILNVETAKAAEVIRVLNQELKAKGYYTVAGRVSIQYFNERYYIQSEEGETA